MPEMEACWPSSVVLRGRALNHPVLRWLKTVVVSDRGEGAIDASGGDQEDVPESARPGLLGACVRCRGVVSTIEVASKAGGLAVLP